MSSLMSNALNPVAEWTNLLLAYRKAAKGKRGYIPAATFEFAVADQLLQLQDELQQKTYLPGGYHHFIINEPKRRKISAAPFRDRVVHHALCNLIEPIFDRLFIPHSYANRIGKGTHRALDTVQNFAQQYRYALRMDIVQHFPSLDHTILKRELFRVLLDEDIRWLITQILASGEGVLRDEYTMVYFPNDDIFAINRPRSLPIGNLTSQFWSNVYMNPLDGFIQRGLGCKASARYVDDFVLFSDNKRQLWDWKQAIIQRLQIMRLTIHAESAQVLPTRQGIPWLGFVIYPTHRKLKRRNAVNFTRRLEHNIDLYQAGKIIFAELDASIGGWIAHVQYADTWGLRAHVFKNHPIPPKKL